MRGFYVGTLCGMSLGIGLTLLLNQYLGAQGVHVAVTAAIVLTFATFLSSLARRK